MDISEAALVIRKMDGRWKPLQSEQSQQEWLEFLINYDLFPAKAALDDLRDTSMWRPTMSEFKTAYMSVLARRPVEVFPVHGQKLLNGHVERSDEVNRALYGHSVDAWVYCADCGMVVTLEERATSARFGDGYGFKHANCPKTGSRPTIPPGERMRRDEYWEKTGIKPT